MLGFGDTGADVCVNPGNGTNTPLCACSKKLELSKQPRDVPPPPPCVFPTLCGRMTDTLW